MAAPIAVVRIRIRRLARYECCVHAPIKHALTKMFHSLGSQIRLRCRVDTLSSQSLVSAL